MSENRNKAAKGVSVIVTMGEREYTTDLRKGDTIYTAYVSTADQGYMRPATERWEGSLTPYRKNRSGEECIDGWCGSTNGVNVDAQGSAIVTQIFKAPADNPMEQKVRVRLTPGAPPTFTLNADYDVVRADEDN